MTSSNVSRVFGILFAWAVLALPSHGYIDVTPTLGRLVNQSNQIVVLKVDKVNLEKRAILFQKVADLKGQSPGGPIKHQITAGLHPREPATILEWVEPGQIAISFQNGAVAEICIGQYWYECTAGPDGWWIMNCGQAQLTFAYKGSVRKLQGHVETLLAGKEALITAVRFGADDAYWRACKRTVAMRDTPQGNSFPICRFNASLKMSGFIYEMYRDPKFVVHKGAAGPEDVPALLAALQDPEWPARLEAAQMLGGIGPDAKKAIPALLTALHDPHTFVRLRAAEALGAIDPGQKEAVIVLTTLRQSADARVRKQAVQALGNTSADAGAILPSLVESLRDKDANVRWAAADAMSRFGPEAAEAVPALIEVAADPDVTVRGAAIDALGSIGPPAKAALPVLHPLLTESSNPLRATIAAAVYRIDRRQAKATIPIFVNELKETDTRLRWHGLYYLRKMVHEAKDSIPVPLLIEAMSDPDFGVRGMAAWLLGEIGPRAEPAVPALVKALSVNDVWVRAASAPALVKILGPKGTMALPVLIEGLGEDDEEARDEFLHALQTLGPAANEAIPMLLWLANKDRAYRGRAAQTIWRISLDAATPVQMLLKELQESDSIARLEAVRMLGQMGPDAKAAIPALRALRDDDDADVRSAGLEALRTIDADVWVESLHEAHAERIAWPWRVSVGVLIIALFGVPIGCWSCAKRAET